MLCLNIWKHLINVVINEKCSCFHTSVLFVEPVALKLLKRPRNIKLKRRFLGYEATMAIAVSPLSTQHEETGPVPSSAIAYKGDNVKNLQTQVILLPFSQDLLPHKTF